MIIKIGICDDDLNGLKKIGNMVHRYMNKIPTSYVVRNFVSEEELLKTFEKFDMLFLDISKVGLNGIQTGIKIKKMNRQTIIIYITNYHEYIEEAVNKVHAFSYMIKPVSSELIKSQIDEAMSYIFEEKQKCETKFFDIIEVTKEGKVEYVSKEFDINDIYYFEYINRKIKLRQEKEEFYFNNTMKELINKMNKYNFVRCHQNFLVNLKHIKRIKGYDILLNNGDKVPVSQKRSAGFRKSLNQFIQGKT